MKIFGKTLAEYLWPIKYYILASVLIVISQYTIALPLAPHYPLLLNVTQGLWVAMVALSVIKLVREYNFGIKNAIVLGIFYCLIIHGLKVAIRAVFYAKPFWYLVERFLYGSSIVMLTVIIIGPLFVYLKKKEIF